jgi:hypothetical protein
LGPGEEERESAQELKDSRGVSLLEEDAAS